MFGTACLDGVPAELARFHEIQAPPAPCRRAPARLPWPSLFRPAIPLRRLGTNLPLWLCVLAMLVRMSLPALHDHGAHGAHAAGTCHHAAATAHCSCGGPHAPSPPTFALPIADEGPCFACELELATPGAAVPVRLSLPLQRIARAGPRTPLATPDLDQRIDGQSARAPPHAPVRAS